MEAFIPRDPPAGSEARQPKRRAHAAERAVLEPQRAAVHRREIDDDRQAEARAGARFVEPPAALERGVARLGIEPGTVVVDAGDEERPARGVGLRIALGADLDARARPFARVVEKVADEVGEILRFAAKPAGRPAPKPRTRDRGRDRPSRRCARARRSPARTSVAALDRVRARRRARAVEIEAHLPAS